MHGPPAPSRRPLLSQLHHGRSAPWTALDVTHPDSCDHPRDEQTRLPVMGAARSIVVVRRCGQRASQRRADRGDTAADAVRSRRDAPPIPIRSGGRGRLEPAADHPRDGGRLPATASVSRQERCARDGAMARGCPRAATSRTERSRTAPDRLPPQGRPPRTRTPVSARARDRRGDPSRHRLAVAAPRRRAGGGPLAWRRSRTTPRSGSGSCVQRAGLACDPVRRVASRRSDGGGSPGPTDLRNPTLPKFGAVVAPAATLTPNFRLASVPARNSERGLHLPQRRLRIFGLAR